VTLIPQWAATATAQVTLASGVTAAATTDGTPVTLANSVPGQNIYAVFAGTAGQNLGIGLTNITAPDTSGTVGVTLTVYKPDGSSWVSGSSGCNTNPPPQCSFTLMNLPQSGNYRIIIAPNVSAKVSLSMTLSQAVSATLSSGTPFTLNLPVPGEFGLLTFTATAGQNLALSVGSVATSPANLNLYVTVYDSTGSQVASGNTTGSFTLNLANLAAGSYTATLIPQWAATASAQVTIQ
jgi:hypothetical protein